MRGRNRADVSNSRLAAKNGRSGERPEAHRPNGRDEPRFGHGRWSRRQLYAIVACYWAKGWSGREIAARIGIGQRLAYQIVRHLEWEEWYAAQDPDGAA
jgi:hypothetical protein